MSPPPKLALPLLLAKQSGTSDHPPTSHRCVYCAKQPLSVSTQGKLSLVITYNEAARGYQNDCLFFRFCFPEWQEGIPKDDLVQADTKYLSISIGDNKMSTAKMYKKGVLFKDMICYADHGKISSS